MLNNRGQIRFSSNVASKPDLTPAFQAFWVGGAVRDRLLGRPVTDGDIVCRHAKKAAQNAARTLPGTLVVLDQERKIFRVVPKKRTGLHTLDFAEMQGRTVEEDLARRDFTINAMAESVNGGDLVDPFNGQRDLKRGFIRAVSQKAFAEDPLRRLRAFRFMAQLGFRIDPKTLRWLSKGTFKGVAHERIRHELLLLMAGAAAGAALRAMDKSGVLRELLPCLEACRRTARRYYGVGGVLEHAFQTVEAMECLVRQKLFDDKVQDYLRRPFSAHPRLALLKLAALLHDIGKPATAKQIKGRLRFFEHEHVGAEDAYQALSRLRFSRQECITARRWVKNHMRLGNLAAAPRTTDKAIARYFRDLGDDGIGMLLLSLADHWTYLKPALWAKRRDPVEKTALRMMDTYLGEQEKVLPKRLVDGHDLMRVLRITPGPLVGAILSRIADAQVEKKITTKEDAFTFSRAILKSLSKRYPNRRA